MKFILSCGGTAGHINPALAVAGRLRELMPDCDILFIGAEGKMEMELVPREGYEILPLKVTNLSRGKNFKAVMHNLSSLKNVLDSISKAKKIIKEFKPDAVIGTGGYVCYPVIMAASQLNIPTAVHESNAVAGLTTKLLSKRVNKLMLGLEDSAEQYQCKEKLVYTGTPVRGSFACYTQNSAKTELGLAVDKPLVLSVWGSLGAGQMNKVVAQMLPLMEGQQDYNFIHSAGSRYYKDFMAELKEKGIDPVACGADIREYIYDMPRVMAAADLIMCRAGASTMSELSYMGKPVIIVPSPNVTNNHQEKNARVFEKAGAAKVVLEKEIDGAKLHEMIAELLADKQKLESMSKAMADMAVADATDKICDVILDLARQN